MSEPSFVLSVIILVIIIFIVLFVIAIIQICLSNDYTDQHISEIDEYDLRSGDIVGVGYTHIFGKFVSSWSQSIWSHTGIIWRHPQTNDAYVLEACNYKGRFVGVFQIPFHLWAKINKHHYKCHLPLYQQDYTKYQGVDEFGRNKYTLKRAVIDSIKLRDEFSKYETCKLDTFNLKWIRFLYQQKYYEQPINDKYTCYEITVSVLQNMGIYKKTHTCSSYFPRNIVNRNVPMCKSYIYGNPIGWSSYVQYS